MSVKGAVLAFMLGLAQFSLEECADMYRRFGSEVFRQNPLVGTMKMGWSHSYYNTETWETILRYTFNALNALQCMWCIYQHVNSMATQSALKEFCIFIPLVKSWEIGYLSKPPEMS